MLSLRSLRDWSKQKHIEPPPRVGRRHRADDLYYLFIYYWLLCAREANAKSVSRVCANIMRMQMRWAAAAHNEFRGDGALVAYDENNEHLHVLCNELMRCSLMCSLIKAIYLLATEHTLAYICILIGHIMYCTITLRWQRRRRSSNSRRARYVQNANKQEAFGKGLGVNAACCLVCICISGLKDSIFCRSGRVYYMYIYDI